MFCEIPDFGRCCFCLPLRRGVLLFGYISIIFSAFMVGIYSYCVHNCGGDPKLLYHGVSTDSVPGVCIALYCVEFIVNCFLVYGAHEKRIIFIKIFYYYAISTTLATLILEIVELANLYTGRAIEMAVLSFCGFCIQIYLIFLVRSLLKKLETSGPHSYDNQLNMIVSGEAKIDNGIYNDSTVIPNQ